MTMNEHREEHRVLFFGLGNPTRHYANTRHNVGFWFADRLCGALIAQAQHCSVEENAQFHLTELVFGDRTAPILHRWHVVKPLTYINRCGVIVPQLLDSLSLSVQQLVVVFDTLDLPVGRVKLKARGSSGGHNGIKSIIEHIGVDFQRVCVGIGRPHATAGGIADYVLSKPSGGERRIIDQVLEQIVDNFVQSPQCSFPQRMGVLNAIRL